MQPSMFNVQVPVRGPERSVPDEHLLRRAAAGLARRRRAARPHRPRRHRAFSDEERETIEALIENGFVVDSRETERRGARRVLHQPARGHRAAAGHGADHAAVQLRVRLLLPGRPRRLQQVRRRRCRSKRRAQVVALDRAAARRGPAREVRADALRRRAAAEPAGRLLPGRAVPRAVRRARRAAAASASSPTACCSRRRSSIGCCPYGLDGVKVTLDGDRDTHNRMRPLRGRQGTFDQIIENVRRVAAQGADHHRRQLRRVVGRQLSGAARLPARAGVRRQDRQDQLQADHQGARSRRRRRASSR